MPRKGAASAARLEQPLQRAEARGGDAHARRAAVSGSLQRRARGQ